MLSIFIYIFTFLLVVVCLLLVLLILMQLPKKDAGIGTAFGGGAADALFGSGAGNILTKATKYLTVSFFVLCISLSVMQNNQQEKVSRLREALDAPQAESPGSPAGQPSISTPPQLNLTNSTNAAPELSETTVTTNAQPELESAGSPSEDQTSGNNQ